MHKPSLILLTLALTASTLNAEKRTIPCKTPAIAASCFTTHGRLYFSNGTPSYRLWEIGTRHVLGIYSGPSVKRFESIDNEHPQMPENIDIGGFPPDGVVFADFEVCPLEPLIRGEMQAACIESAKHVVTQKY